MTDTEPSAPTPDTPPPATPQSATPQQAPKQQPAVQRLYRTATRGEAVAGMAWLCLGAIISMFLEVIYLGTWMFGVAVPYTIPIAFCFEYPQYITYGGRGPRWKLATICQKVT